MIGLPELEKLINNHREQEQLILLAALSSLWLQPQDSRAGVLLERYKARGYSLDALREAALQMFIVAGFQTSLEAAFQIKDVYGRGLPEVGGHAAEFDATEWLDRGRKLQAQVYRDNVEKLRKNLENISPELADWTVIVGYGLVMSRPGLSRHWRELLEIAVLATSGFPRQLHSHFLGAMNLGAQKEEIDLVLDAIEPFVAADRMKSAHSMWRHLKK